MAEVQHQGGGVLRVCFRSLVAACLTLSIAILWGEARRQSIQEVTHGLPVTAGLVCGGALLVASCVLFRRLGRLAIWGLAVSIWTTFVCLLPTLSRCNLTRSMNPNESIVHGGGWHKRQTMGRPKTRFFVFLSVALPLASLIGIVQFLDGWPKSFGYMEWLGSVLLVLQVVWGIMAVVFRLTEPPRVIVSYESRPDHKRTNL